MKPLGGDGETLRNRMVDRQIVAAAQLRPDSRVLEIGAGSG